MSMVDLNVCPLNDIIPFGGVAALAGSEQVAIFRLGETDEVYALSNYDPFSQANVMSRGITGSISGEAVIASPIYKQHFVLKTGVCIEDESVSLKTWPARVENGDVILSVAAA